MRAAHGAWTLGLVLSAAEVSASVPQVRYATRAETRTWEPIAIEEVEPIIERGVMEALTAQARLRLERSNLADVGQGEHALLVRGRFVEEAERFSVYLVFGPGQAGSLPSVHVADTSDPLGGRPRAELERLLRETAVRAGARLAAALAPLLAAGGAESEDTLPYAWGPITVPDVPRNTKALRELLDVRQPGHVRHGALRELRGSVLDQQVARNAVELCLLRDPAPDVRLECARALEPVARERPPTQRVLLGAARAEVEEAVLAELVEISASFVGLSRLETLATWQHLVAEDATPPGGARRAAGLLAKEDAIPNLELVVRRCLGQGALVYGKKSACASELLPRVPAGRLLDVLGPYLADLRAFGGGSEQTFDEVLRSLDARLRRAPDPSLGEALLVVAERRSAGRARRKALGFVADHASPTEATLDRVAALGLEPGLAIEVSRALGELAGRAPTLAGRALAHLRALRERGRWLPRPGYENPIEALDRQIGLLEGAQGRSQPNRP